MERLFGKRPVGTSAVTGVATNQELIDSLQKKAKDVNITNPSTMEEFNEFYQNHMKPVYDAMYPDEMKQDTITTIEQDLYGANGMAKLFDFARKWMGTDSE